MISKYKFFLLGMYCMISMPLFSQNIYLEINLNNHAIQSRVRSVRPKPSLEVFRVIERAGRDNKIHGIILNISGFTGSQEYLWELRSSLEKFKVTGKKVCVFFSAANIDMYMLASVADKIVMDDLGTLTLLGYSWGKGYVQQSLEKLGVGVNELRYFEYKSAAEMFTRDSMSEADRRQYGDYLEDIFKTTRDLIIQARSWTEEEFNTILDRDFIYSAKNAKERGLVDFTGRKDAVMEAVKELEGEEVKHFALYGDPSSSLIKTSSNYRPERVRGFFKRPPVIAVVYANGQTDMERGLAARSLSRTIHELADKKRVKAIIIKINSPGGSAEAADYIDEAVRYAKEKKPVVVSMGQVAASGGYWASMNANHITASPYTITGSIGVIANWFYDNGLNTKLGLSVDSIQKGAHADMATGFLLPRRNLNAEEEQRYKKYIMDMYSDFTNKAAAGRNMDIEKLEAVAQGRIFSGYRALDAGLIDSIGSLYDAINIARNLAKIDEDTKVRYNEFPKPKFLDKMLNRFPEVSSVFAPPGNNKINFFTNLFFSEQIIADLHYRLEKNGKVMPILPIDTGF